MPVMNGWEALKIICKDPELSKIPVVVLTTSSDYAQNKVANQKVKIIIYKPKPSPIIAFWYKANPQIFVSDLLLPKQSVIKSIGCRANVFAKDTLI